MGLSLVRNGIIYQVIRDEHEKNKENKYPITALCKLGNVTRAAYYKWLHRGIPAYEEENRRIAEKAEEIHRESPDKGYRRIRDDLEHDYGIKANDKRVLRICRKLGIKSTIKYGNNGCTRQASNPQFIAENTLNRDFNAEAPDRKWLTDVTEFKYYIGIEKHKLYLSAILDLYDRRIVSYVVGDSNNNALVFDTFDKAVAENPEARPLFHSDRGFQYTNRRFHEKLEKAGMKQSMSRVAKCIDNGPMEGFWGILKRERYYGRRFTDRDSLVQMITEYIGYYNNQRLQRRLGVLTPMEKHQQYLEAV
jgi:transposase InsO family protein